MAEGGMGTCPQVFVVDSQANHVSVPGGKKSRWARAGQKSLLLLVGLALSGLVVEGCFIYRLHKRTEELSLCKSHPLCQNLSNSQTSGQHGGTILGQVGSKESNEIPTVRPHLEQVQDRPFAQLIGSSNPAIGATNVVQWEHKDGETIIHKMGYENGHLLVEKAGYYYLYAKVALNAKEDCPHFHRVMKLTSAYGNPIELMKAKSFCRRTTNPSSTKASVGDDVWNSFLAGIFHLQAGDKIFVTLEKIQKMLQGSTDNLMGAFMIFPGDMLQQ